ncbi:MAG: DUF4339 domain-containing protein [Tannerella sp.]|jgi:hypothetical protein|nr:DUF4339 domain-containing protein [Tannerella sp.]
MENRYYYLTKDKKPIGPFSLETLKKEPITPTTQIWHTSLPAIKEAGTLPELADLFMLPIPSEEHQEQSAKEENPVSAVNTKTNNMVKIVLAVLLPVIIIIIIILMIYGII